MSRMAEHKQSLVIAIVSMSFAGVCMVGMSIFVKFAQPHTTINIILFFRFAFFFLVMLPFFIQKKAYRYHEGNLSMHLIRGTCALFSIVCYFTALYYLPIANAGVLAGSTALFVPVVLYFTRKVPIIKKLYWGIVTGLIGVILVLHPSTGFFHVAAIIALLAAIFRAFSATYIRQLSKTDSPLTILFYYFLIGTIVTTISLLFTPNEFSDLPWLDLLAIGVFGGIYQFLLTFAFRHAPSRIVAPFSYLTVVFAVIADWAIWQQLPTITTFIGIAVIILGGLLAIYFGRSILSKKTSATQG